MPARNRNGLLPLGAFHQKFVADGELYALGQRNRLVSNSRHKKLPLPHVAENFSAHAFLARRPAGHDSARRGQNVDPQASQNARHCFEPTYTRHPGRDTRSIREITGMLPGVYFR